MARSSTIWIVQPLGCITPSAAFTVKHALVSYLKRLPPKGLSNIVIWRMPDGNASGESIMIAPVSLLD